MTRVEDAARAAWYAAVEEMDGFSFDNQRDAFCDGYETGYAAAAADEAARVFYTEEQVMEAAKLLQAWWLHEEHEDSFADITKRMFDVIGAAADEAARAPSSRGALDALNASLHRELYDIEPCASACTHLGVGGLWWEQPSMTLGGDPRAAAAGEGTGIEPIRLTVRDALVLQSFRPDYPVQGTKTAQFSQIGNAVPPLLAARVLEQFA